jgi:imidazole glycerol phosphate synthase glutamine amidotransferase subunit
LGVNACVSDDPSTIAAAQAVVLPGVGHFGSALRGLRSRGLDRAIADRVVAGRPLLAICLGMQILCEASEEAPNERGLSLIPGIAASFPRSVRSPQMGWSRILPCGPCNLLRPASVYFANSFRLERCPPGWSCAFAEHGGQFVAAVERGGVLACQFHPELSGSAGLQLVSRWLAAANVLEAQSC